MQVYNLIIFIGSGWNFYCRKATFDGVITDLRQNVVCISTNRVWQTAVIKFWNQAWELDPWTGPILGRVEGTADFRQSLFSGILSGNETVYIGLSALFIMGAAWYGIARWMAKSMAGNNAASIEGWSVKSELSVKETMIIRFE